MNHQVLKTKSLEGHMLSFRDTVRKVWDLSFENLRLLIYTHTHTHTHTHIHIYTYTHIYIHIYMKWKSLSCIRLFVTSWTVNWQGLLSVEFSRQEYWSRLPFPSLGDLSRPGIEPGSPALQADSLPSELPGKPIYRHVKICMCIRIH